MSRRNIYILSGLGLLVLVVAFWFVLLSPLMDDIDANTKQIEAETQAISVAQTKLAQVEQFKVQAERNQSRLIELAKMVPQEEEIPSLILQIQDLAAEAGIDFLTISPSSAAAGTSDGTTSFKSVSLSLTMSGRFFDINDFLYRAEQMASGPGRLLRVDSVSLSKSGQARVGRSPRLDADIGLTAYTRVSTAAAPVAPAAPAPAAAGSAQSSPTNKAG